jgi:glycosyltransferase involved in cell wall biosynthesis
VLNAGKFLQSRLDSIFAQSISDWELVVVDGFSDDGSWETIKDRCSKDPRVQLHQQPRQGIYAAFNRCIELSKSDYIYIATADDTMLPNCLETLLTLCQQYGRTCIAQCGLNLIDEFNQPLPDESQWPANAEWRETFADSFHVPHIRKAPFDGAAVMTFGTLITSLTQALFPREIFSSIGFFPKQFSSTGDVAWEAITGFFYDVVYTPERLATWRLHSSQATALNSQGWYDRNVLIGAWVLDELKMRDSSLWEHATKIGLNDCRRFAAIQNKHYGQGVMRRLVATFENVRDCPRFYRDYVLEKIVYRKDIAIDPTTSVRRRQVSNFTSLTGGSLITR